MSLRRDLRRLLRAATAWLKADAKRREHADTQPEHKASDGGKGAAALDKALDEFKRDPVLDALDTTPPRSYAGFGEPGHIAGPVAKAPPPAEPG